MNHDGKCLIESIGSLLTHTILPQYEFSDREIKEIEIATNILLELVSIYEDKTWRERV